MVHTRKALNNLAKRQLITTLLFVLSLLKTRDAKKYKEAEKKLGLGGSYRARKGSKSGGGAASKKRRTGKRSKGRKTKGAKRRTGKGKRRLAPGTHSVRVNGRLRRVLVNSKGQWKFLKG